MIESTLKKPSLTGHIKKNLNSMRLFNLITVALLAGFAILTLLVFHNKTGALDNGLSRVLLSWRSRGLSNFFNFVLNNGFILFLMGFSVLFFLLRKRPWLAGLEVVAALGGLLISSSLKDLFQRIGPGGLNLLNPEYSYPSGHATVTIALVGVLVVFGVREIKWTWLKQLFSLSLVLVVLAIGLGMVYFRNHFATDILAGWLIGGCYLSLLVVGYKLFANYLKNRLKTNRLL